MARCETKINVTHSTGTGFSPLVRGSIRPNSPSERESGDYPRDPVSSQRDTRGTKKLIIVLCLFLGFTALCANDRRVPTETVV